MNDKLEQLIKLGCIKSYKISNVSDDGVVGAKSPYRNSEQLFIEFPNGETMIVDIYCSGFNEDVGIVVQ